MAISHATRTDEVYLFLRQKITEGEIPFGSRLHITNLAKETGFSNTPIREALVKLETFGLAKSYPHRGVFVVEPCKSDVDEMLEGRLCIELYVAAAVLENVKPTDIPKMRAACEESAKVRPSVELFFEQGLHGYYAKLGGNTFLEHLYQRVMVLLNVFYVQGFRNCTDEKWLNDYRHQHYLEEMEIVDAIETGEILQLEKAVKVHVENFGSFIFTTLQNWPPQGLNWNDQIG